MGKVRITVYLKCGTMEVADVDSVMGWDYCGEFLIVNEMRDGVTVSRPYCMRDIDYFTRESIETVH